MGLNAGSADVSLWGPYRSPWVSMGAVRTSLYGSLWGLPVCPRGSVRAAPRSPRLDGEAVWLPRGAAGDAGPVDAHPAGVAAFGDGDAERPGGQRGTAVRNLHRVHAWGGGDVTVTAAQRRHGNVVPP